MLVVNNLQKLFNKHSNIYIFLLSPLAPTQYQNPPGGVKLVMEAVCVMRSVKPERKPDPSTGKMAEDFWGPSQKLLGDMKFLEYLKTYDKDNISPAIMKKIRDK